MNRNPRNPNTPNHQSPSSDESGPLPFGNFDESAGAIAPESNDRDLVAFLKQHQPIAPPEPANFEADLMAAIAQEPLPVSGTTVIRKPKRWRMIVGAIAADNLVRGSPPYNSRAVPSEYKKDSGADRRVGWFSLRDRYV